MRMTIAAMMITILVALSTGCFTTTYGNLYSTGHTPPADSQPTIANASGWQSFFIFGWVPGEKVIDSKGICGEGRVKEIRTQRSFVQGLIAAVAGYYINVYSPWTGETVCSARKT